MVDPYAKRAEEVLRGAIDMAKESERKQIHVDNKYWVKTGDISNLILAGADVAKLNAESIGHMYVHEVMYRGQIFISQTKEPYERPNLKM